MDIHIHQPDGRTVPLADTDYDVYREVLETVVAEGMAALMDFFDRRRWPVMDVAIGDQRMDIHMFDPVAQLRAARSSTSLRSGSALA